ncbi:chitinase [Photobacterium leiognathi]|uniref:chitinase n=1 Tax=Photobacterium leiognathi TaxID=553611 RepID=UPI0029824762|nr:chitinase [Photobacterium leiognathi]
MLRSNPAKKVAFITLLSASMGLFTANVAAQEQPFELGVTKVSNGDVVSYQGECFKAKNSPGTWEAPKLGSWFWDQVTCSNDTVEPPVEPEPPVVEPEPPVTEPEPPTTDIPSDVTPFVLGETRVANGDVVSYQQQCYIAQNNPGVWEAPKAGSWFWEPTNCGSTTEPPLTCTLPEVLIDNRCVIPPVECPDGSSAATAEECPVIPPVTCPDGSTADSVELCPPAKVVCDDGSVVDDIAQCPVTPVTCPDGSTASSVADCPVAEVPTSMTVTSDGKGGYLIPRAEFVAIEKSLTSGELFDLVRSDTVTLDNASVEAVLPLRAANPENVKRAESIVDEALWEFLFPIRNPAYTYNRFLQAIAKFPAFCRTYTDGRDSLAICKRSLATMFAHFVQETGAHAPNWEGALGNPEWRQGLYYVREVYKSESDTTGPYNKCTGWAGERWPCANKSYFGRGAKQLSWNYNYGPFSEAMFGDKMVLLEKPELVADTWLNLASAVFFYVYPQPPKPSMLHVIDGTWQPNAADKANGIEHGFGSTIQIINGAFECGKGSTTAQAKARIAYYKEITSYLNLDISGEKLDCADMKAFDTAGAGALEVYWDKDWGWDANTPGNHSFKCKLVGYQTAYSAWTAGDYELCVEDNFNVQATDANGEIIPK